MTKLDELIRAAALLEVASGTKQEKAARRALAAAERDFTRRTYNDPR